MAVSFFILGLAGTYVMIGAVIATLFVTRFIDRRDPAAAHAPWSFRIVIWPGCVALWPVLIVWLHHPTTQGGSE